MQRRHQLRLPRMR